MASRPLDSRATDSVIQRAWIAVLQRFGADEHAASLQRSADTIAIHSRTLDADRMCAYLCHTIDLLLQGDRRLDVMPADERAQLAAWNATARADPDGACVHELVAAQVDRTPDATALVFGDERVTYRELDDRANRLAHHLAGLGAGREQVVGVVLERSVELVVALLAIWKAGAAYLPLDPRHPRERLGYIVQDARARLVITTTALRSLVPRDASIVAVELDVDRAAIATRPATRPAATVAPTQLAYILYTSGSTGRPKGVAVQHGSVRNVLASLRRSLELGPHDTMLAISTVSFDIAALELWLPLWVGATVVVSSADDAIDPSVLAQQLERRRVTIFQATPATWRMLVDAGWAGRPEMVGISTGEALPASLARAVTGKVKRLWNLYGPTEITIYSTARVVGVDESPVRIGGPIDNTRHYVLDRALDLLPIGIPGELYIGGEGLARGYHGRPDLTAERFVPDPFGAPGARMYRTGDLVRWCADGTLEYLGRLDHQVKIRGFRIELAEIEATLAEHPGVAHAVVVARATQLVAYVVPRDGALEAAALRAHVATRLPDYMIPAAFVTLTALPLTPSGKIDRKALPAPDEHAFAHAAYVAPRTPDEETLAAIWRDVLGVDRVGVHDDFFALGGNSLLAMRVIARIEEAFELTMPLSELFRAPTVDALVARVFEMRADEIDPEVLAQLFAETLGPSERA